VDVGLLFGAGLVIGAVLGALGGGGSILAVPALIYLGGQSAQAATSASLVVVGLGALSGLASHLPSGHVRVKSGLAFGAVGVLGSVAGSWLNRAVPEDVLVGAFVVLLVAVAGAMILRRVRGSGPTGGDFQVHIGRVLVAGTAVGFLTGFLGVGGGFVIVPALVLAMGFTMPAAIGTSLVVIAVNVVVALGARLGTLDIPWAMTMALAAGTMLGSWTVGRLSARFDPRTLTAGFAGLLIVVAGVMGTSLVMG
jgi:uncharacterized membrane protein YfcA